MTDYSEWLEAAVGMETLGELAEHERLQNAAVHKTRRDAVLCLVDCQLGMFQEGGYLNYSSKAHFFVGANDSNNEKNNSSGNMTSLISGVSISGRTSEGLNEDASRIKHQATNFSLQFDVDDADEARRELPVESATGMNFAARNEVGEDTGAMITGGNHHNTTPFQSAIRCVLSLYKDKVIASDKDLVALAFYNTNMQCNIYDVPGLYIFHPFSLLNVQSVQELQELVAAGDIPSTCYEEFKKNIGHIQDSTVRLSDVLWASQHMFLSLHNDTIKYRRIFIFTNDDNPHKGDMPEMERCSSRIQELHECDVTVEIFALGKVPHSNLPMLDRVISVVDDANLSTCFDQNTERCFDHGIFWDQLRPKAEGIKGETERNHSGGLCLTVGMETFGHLRDAVKRRTHPQRPAQNYELTIGMSVDGSPVPTMAVSVYNPLLPASLPRPAWLDRRTNAIASRRSHLFVRRTRPTSTCPENLNKIGESENIMTGHVDAEGSEKAKNEAEDDDEESFETTVSPESLFYSIIVGGRRFFFSPEERKQILTRASAGAPVGFSIICFKHAEDALQHKYAICKSSFLCPNPHDGGDASLRLFVKLSRALLRQNKVAIAQYVARRGAPPRLVALVPSSPSMSLSTQSLPTKGLGLYVVPLPYAEDIRSVPSLPCFDATTTIPSQEDLDLAERIITSLSISYDINAVPNPSLQLRYQTLQELALKDTSAAAAEEEGTVKFDGTENRPGVVADMSLPDHEGMRHYAQLFHEFNTKVLDPSYNADRLCPQSKRNVLSGRKIPPTGEDNASSDDTIVHLVEAAFEQNALPTLTVVQLRGYLSALGESAAGARRKDDVIQVVTRVLLKLRKRESIE